MARLIGNAVVGQSGGPTSAINATLAGVIRGALAARDDGFIPTLYGMKNGIEGFLREELVDLFAIFGTDGGEDRLSTLETTPAAALGSCRRKLKDHVRDAATFDEILRILKKFDIRYFFYIGGNDSMDTVLKLSNYAKDHDYELRVVGVPKTIDNDLMATDHTPGFGSAAKFVATTVKEILRDIAVYTLDAVTVVEIMGRDAGWLTAASALPVRSGGIGPDLIHLPERVFDPDAFIRDVRDALTRHPAVLVCASEGIRLADGHYVGEGTDSRAVDAFGHTALSGTGRVLESLVKREIGCKVRSIELSLPQRCAAHICSLTDITESVAIGSHAVRAATAYSATGVMVIATRTGNGSDYAVTLGTADISTIANEIRTVPAEYINAEGNGITEAGLDYLEPLIKGEAHIEYENGLPKHFVL